MNRYFLSLLIFCCLFCACSKDHEEISSNAEKEQVNSKEHFRKKLIGTWILQTYIRYAYEGLKFIEVKELSAEQINDYSLESWLDITFNDDLFYYSQTVNEDPSYKDKKNLYEIIDWNKNWMDDNYEYVLHVYRPNNIYYNHKGGAKFIDDNTLKWMHEAQGFIFKRK